MQSTRGRIYQGLGGAKMKVKCFVKIIKAMQLLAMPLAKCNGM